MSHFQTDLEGRVPILDESGLVSVRQQVRQRCVQCGFSDTDTTRIVTAASELARNVYRYAARGEMYWRLLENGQCTGIELVFEDKGPGIPDVDLAMRPGYSTSRGLGLGLPGAKRLMDELEIASEPGMGTRVMIRKHRR